MRVWQIDIPVLDDHTFNHPAIFFEGDASVANWYSIPHHHIADHGRSSMKEMQLWPKCVDCQAESPLVHPNFSTGNLTPSKQNIMITTKIKKIKKINNNSNDKNNKKNKNNNNNNNNNNNDDNNNNNGNHNNNNNNNNNTFPEYKDSRITLLKALTPRQ
jgi:hypothetical protein